ncbi:tripartite motif-containing protein 34-like [Salvelinus namaycush]|uniref:Tripartite motif-containing protein 34-like n=1 Tax=Salvelinus namaycush TaxID=8040 RepID=A0A8U0QEM0_SALNM|nr:tripartite motif-containing protein 34-like [Salvelinus namaycush]
MLDLEMWRVMSALGPESGKPSCPVCRVWPLTVRLTSNLTMNLLLSRSTSWSKPPHNYRRRSALISSLSCLIMTNCRTDQQCICYLCTMDEHKGHDTVSAAAERTEKQRQLGMSQQKDQQRFQEREKELKELQQAVESFKAVWTPFRE